MCSEMFRNLRYLADFYIFFFENDVVLNCIHQIFLTCTSGLFIQKTQYTRQLNIQANVIKKKGHNFYNFKNRMKKLRTARGIYEKYFI